jgi:hypothetical protein
MNGKQATQLEIEIEALKIFLICLEYDFTKAITFGDRRSIYKEYVDTKDQIQVLVNFSNW